jgi:hypothetical protein
MAALSALRAALRHSVTRLVTSVSRAFTMTGVDVQQCAVRMLIVMRGGIGGSAASYAQLLWCLVGDEHASPSQLTGRWQPVWARAGLVVGQFLILVSAVGLQLCGQEGGLAVVQRV